ncbi:Crustacyanin-C1 subunit [Penaeus vannamei]|uniref:Crustacyanin-C1 subunit n=1 Tax=Penaeus vannamei TaxID=6689 RepID=A0A423U556_PENVA|nr:Crustacyanin-C1 subunit [Penaeus vannamei]
MLASGTKLPSQTTHTNSSSNGSKFIAKSTGINADGNLMRHNGQVFPCLLETLISPSTTKDVTFTAPYVILDTDYENFSCIYSCVEFNYGYYADFAFIFSRSPSLSDQYLRRCEAAFKEIGVDVSRFAKTVQGSNCPYDTQKSL